MIWKTVLDSVMRRAVLPLVLLAATILRYNVISLFYLLLLMVCLVLPRPVLRPQKCASIVYFVLLLCVSLVGTLGQPLFQFTLLPNSTYHLPYCSAQESMWRQFGFIQFVRPDTGTVPAVDIVRHYLPDVVVLVFTIITMVTTLFASRKPNVKSEEGNGREQPRTAEEREAAGNEPEAVETSMQRPAPSGAASGSHGEGDSDDPHMTVTLVTTSHDRQYWQLPVVVTQSVDLAIFFVLGASAVAVPSVTSGFYLAIFLLKAALWALHLEGWNRRLFVRLLMLVYTGCHLVVLYLYQFEGAQKLILLQPFNTTSSFVGRLFGLTPVVCTNCSRPTELTICPDTPSNYIIGPIFLFILYWLIATDLTLWLSTPGSLWKFSHAYFLLHTAEPHPSTLEHAAASDGSDHDLQQATQCSDDTYPQGAAQHVQRDDPEGQLNLSLSMISLDQVKRKGRSFYYMVKKGFPKRVAVLWRNLMRVNFVFSIVAMMLWSVFYPCWLSLVLLLWACIIWIIPRLNPRLSLYYTSPALVAYTVGLLCLQYVYSLDGPDLPSSGSFIVIRSRVQDRSFHLAMEAVFVLLFLASLHEFVTMLKEKHSQNQLATDTHSLATDFSSHLYSAMFQLLSAYWIIVVFGAFLLAIMAGDPSWLKSMYIVVFYISLLIYQLFKSLWRHLVTPLWCFMGLYAMVHLLVIYTARFETIFDLWTDVLNSTGADPHDMFLSIGIFKYEAGNARSLFETLVPLAIFIAVLAMQLRYFMFPKPAQQSDQTDFSVMMSVIDYFVPTPSGLDQSNNDGGSTGGGGAPSGVDQSNGDRGSTGGGGPPSGLDQSNGDRGSTRGGDPPSGLDQSNGDRGSTIGGGPPSGLDQPDGDGGSTRGGAQPPASVTAHQSTSEKVYRVVRTMVVRLRQLTVALIYLVWRFLALHGHKVAMLTLFIVSLSQISAAYLLLLLMAIVASPLPRVHRVLYPLITAYLGLVATAKMVYQAPLLDAQNVDFTAPCNVSVGPSPVIIGMVFNDSYSPLSSNPSWIGLHKVITGSNFASYIAGPIVAALVLTLWMCAQRYQEHYYRTDHIVLGVYDEGALFLDVSRDKANQSLIDACKYLINHFFEMYGLETCWCMLAIAVTIRIDVYGLFYALVLLLFMVVSRLPSKGLLVVWTLYLVFHGVLLGIQYALLLGVPEGVCLSPGTGRDYPWGNMEIPLKKWLFLTQSKLQILDKNLLYADIFVYFLLCFQLRCLYSPTPANTNTNSENDDNTDGVLPRIFDLAVWFDYFKIVVFKYSFWLTLFMVFLFSTLQISLFGWVYLLVCFIFLFRGQNLLKDELNHRIIWWRAFRWLVSITLTMRIALQIIDCAFTKKAVQLYRILFDGNCNSQAYYGSLLHDNDSYNIGLWTDAVCFILLTIQIIITNTKYAEAVKKELIMKDASSTSFASIMEQRIAENQNKAVQERNDELLKLDVRMNELSEQLNTIEHVLHARVKIPPHITRRYGRKSLPKALLISQGIQDEVDHPPSADSQTNAEEEPRSKDEDQEELPSEPLCRKMATFVVTLVDMSINWLNKSSEDYRYVVQRVRGKESGGPSSAAASPTTAEPRENKIEDRHDVLVTALNLEPTLQEREDASKVERELVGEAERRVGKVRQLLAALYYSFLAHSEFIVYFLIVLNVLLNGSVLSLVYAFLMFSWGLLSYPWPNRKFWIVLASYTMAVILLRYAFQFKQVDTGDDCQSKNFEKGRCPTQIVGIYDYGRKFYSYVVWDFILLLAVFIHTALLKEYGLWVQAENERAPKNPFAQLWKDFKSFLAHLKSSDKLKGSRGGKDYYTIMLFFDILVFITIVLGASSFGISTAQGGVVQVISLVKSNTVPMGFVVFLLLQFLSMLVDRAIYLRHSIKAKFVFHVLLLFIWHVWLFFVLPAITAQAFFRNVPAQFIYFFKCFYFVISSMQIIVDYPVQSVGWFLRRSYNIVSSTLFLVYKSIPLLPELREMIDWVFTDTVLDVFHWLTVQKLWYIVYQIKNRREQEKREVRVLGTPPSLPMKILYGSVLILLFLALIWGPLFFFSLVTETGSPNPANDMSIDVSLEGFQTLLTARQLNISEVTDDQYEKFINAYNGSLPQVGSIYKMENFQRVLISSQPAAIWTISPPAREQLVEKVRTTLQTGGSLELLASWTIARTPDLTTAQLQVSGQRTIELSNSTLRQLYCSFNGTDPTCSGVNGEVLLTNLFPYYIYAPGTGKSIAVADLTGESIYVSCQLSLNSSSFGGPSEWWTLQKANATDLAGIELLVYSDKVAAGFFSSVANLGIIGLYVSIVFAIGRIIHGFVESLPFSLIFDEILCPDVLWQLLEDIYLVRSRGKFDLEEILVGRLFAVIRSPESIIQLTEFEKPKRD